MVEHDLITCQLIWPESKKRYQSRNPFPTGGVVEDPATGAAAAAFGGYLRELGKIGTAARFSIVQGVEMGRPSRRGRGDRRRARRPGQRRRRPHPRLTSRTQPHRLDWARHAARVTS